MDRLSQVVASPNESDSSALMKFPDLDANVVKQMMEAARDGPLDKFDELWRGVDWNFHVKDESRSFTRWAELGLTREKLDALREETLRMDGEHVVCPGRTALHMAVGNGQKDIVRSILKRELVDINIQDKFGYTPLHLAVANAQSDFVLWFLGVSELNININIEDKFGYTPLHMAVANGHSDIVRWILEWSHVNINIEDKFGYTLLHLACHSPVNHDAVIDTLMDSDQGRSSMNANAVSTDGFTPLHFAVRGKFKRTVERLLEWKPSEGEYYNSTIDVGVKSNEGETPLLLAVHRRNKGDHSEELTWIIRRLFRHIKTNCPENINQTDNERKSAVHISIESCDYELMNLILEEGGHKVDFHIKDSEGKSAWEVAFQQPHYAVVHKLQNYLERVGLYGNQEAYAGAANAILVVAALLATVTFNSWSLITVAESTLFWVFSSLSFLFAISTLLAAGGAALPSRGSTIADIRNTIHAASFCLAISISCAIGAFATAAFYYAPSIKYKRKVIVTIGIGGIFCLNFLVGFVRRLARAYSPFFLYTDFRRREFLYKHVIARVEGWLERRKFVRDLKRWYEETVINPAISSIPESKSMGVKGSDDSIEVGTKEGIGR